MSTTPFWFSAKAFLLSWQLTIVVLVFVLVSWIVFKLSVFDAGVCSSNQQMKGKIVIITGGNTGIGKETALDLANRGARVYIACRDQKKGAEAVTYIKKHSQFEEVYLKELDLASFESIHAFAKEFKSCERELHVLINNAGVMMCPFARTKDGLEMQLGVNHFGHFLLTNLLLDVMKSTAAVPSSNRPVRIVNLSSLGHNFAFFGISYGSWNIDRHSWNLLHRTTAYAESKLANILFTTELDRQLKAEGVPIGVYAVHPGTVMTDLWRHTPLNNALLNALLSPLLKLFFKSPSLGAQTSIHCAVASEVDKDSGEYFVDCHVSRIKSRHAGDQSMAKKLWELSERITGL